MSETRPPFNTWMEQHMFSATDVENYRLCPYRFYASAYLGLKPEDAFEVELKPSEVGSLTHRILERLFRGEVSTERAERLLEEELARVSVPRPHLSRPLLALQRARLSRMLKGCVEDLARETEADPSWRPAFYEWEFGGAKPPLILKDAEGIPTAFRGRIDRIDVNESKRLFLVVDYKTGSTRISGNQIKSGEAIQLPLYLLAVRELLLRDYEPAGAVYYRLADLSKRDGLLHGDRLPSFLSVGPRSSSLVPVSKWDAVLEAIVDRIGRIVAAIRKTPEEGFLSRDEACEPFCPYRDICRLRSS